nr:MAG TPA: nucelotide kinase [Caudoviricetes sp.]DAW35507.1 MAG TPA: nucelotide kinase [Caudoviricetes sp.]
MSRTVHYDTNGNEIDAEDCINDAPTYPQEQLADFKEKEEQMVTKVTNCGKCKCKNSCGCNPGTVGCALALRRLADIERHKVIDHPAYYKAGGVEAIDAIEAWGLGFNLGNVVKYIARAGHKTADSLQDLKKAAWYLEREIERMKTNEVRT